MARTPTLAAALGNHSGRILLGPKNYGVMPGVPMKRGNLGRTPALEGLFRSGRITVGISQINAMATHVNRGGGQ